MHCPQVGHRCLTLSATLTSVYVACCPAHPSVHAAGSSVSDSETASAGTAGTAPSALGSAVPKCRCTRACSAAETCWRSCLERAALELLRSSSPIMLYRRGTGVGLERPEQWCCREALRSARCAPLPSRALQAGHQVHRVDCAYPGLAVRLSMLCKPAASLKHQGSHSSSPVVLCRQGSKASTEAHPLVTFHPAPVAGAG